MSFDGYRAEMAAGLQQGMGDITRSAIAGVGDAYQQFLTADAVVDAPHGLTGTMETVSYEMERVEPPAALETDPEPSMPSQGVDIDMDR